MYRYVFFSGPNTGKYGPEKTPYLDTFHMAMSLDSIHTVMPRVNSKLIPTVKIGDSFIYRGKSFF